MVWPWLWVLVALGWGGVASCPERCVCRREQGLLSADCSVLPSSGGKLESLTLRPSSPADRPLELIDGQFNSARHLKYLSLTNCSIYFVHKKAFYNSKNLLEIDLSFNYIEVLEPTVFQHLTSLTTLNLRGNPIHFVPEVPFLVSNSLMHLDLGQCKLRNVPRGIFYGLKRLKYLSLDGNFLKSLKYNSLPKGLKYLNLSNNLIVNVPIEVLSALTNLRELNLAGNPINCSCSLMNLQDWLSGRGVIFEENVTCALPFEYHGVSWSKVDENRLCLAEAKREEMSQSAIYNPFFKSHLYKESYFDDESGYSVEDLQSDQPRSLHPDTQAEVLFQNDETLAMGEMMRDEEAKQSLNDDSILDANKEQPDSESDSTKISSKLDDPNERNPKLEAEDIQGLDTSIAKDADEDGHKKEETILSVDGDGIHVFKNSNNGSDENSPVVQDLSSSDGDVQNKNLNDETENLNEDTIEMVSTNDDTVIGKSENLLSTINEESKGDVIAEVNQDLSQSENLNKNTPVEFKLNEDESNAEADDLKKEGFFHVGNNNNKPNDSTPKEEGEEETTILPDIEDTTDAELLSTQETFMEEDNNGGVVVNQNISTTEPNVSDTNFEDIENSEEDKVIETVPPPVIVPEVDATNCSSTSQLDSTSEPSTAPPVIPEDSSSLRAGPDNTSSPIKEVAGAEVVMFCVAVLIICLILYSVYKCRTSKKSKNVRLNKDIESNRGTEMQDMASLIPKPQDDKKSNSKYPDKAPSSETMKLIPESNENETNNFIPDSSAKTTIEDKNSINNNPTSSPTSKTPLIKSETPITINPAGPIQRTKVKVGILPDSIPRTPIFVQKSYTNGTKHV